MKLVTTFLPAAHICNKAALIFLKFSLQKQLSAIAQENICYPSPQLLLTLFELL